MPHRHASRRGECRPSAPANIHNRRILLIFYRRSNRGRVTAISINHKGARRDTNEAECNLRWACPNDCVQFQNLCSLILNSYSFVSIRGSSSKETRSEKIFSIRPRFSSCRTGSGRIFADQSMPSDQAPVFTRMVCPTLVPIHCFSLLPPRPPVKTPSQKRRPHAA
jgi:hypothetical protein